RNNGNQTFTDITSSVPGLRDIRESVRQALFLDFDNDGDLDLLVILANGSVRLLENLRQDRFRDVTAERGLTMDHAWGAAVADVDRNGWFDVLIAGDPASRSAFFRNREGHF